MATPEYRLASMLKEAYRVCDVRPLSLENIDRYYIYIPFEACQNAVSDINGKLFVIEPGEFNTIILS